MATRLMDNLEMALLRAAALVDFKPGDTVVIGQANRPTMYYADFDENIPEDGVPLYTLRRA